MSPFNTSSHNTTGLINNNSTTTTDPWNNYNTSYDLNHLNLLPSSNPPYSSPPLYSAGNNHYAYPILPNDHIFLGRHQNDYGGLTGEESPPYSHQLIPLNQSNRFLDQHNINESSSSIERLPPLDQHLESADHLPSIDPSNRLSFEQPMTDDMDPSDHLTAIEPNQIR